MLTIERSRNMLSRMTAAAAAFLLVTYRNILSGLKMRCCRFYPSCSEYALEAIKKYGIFRGGLYTIQRLGRCHPFSDGGYDPVP